MLSCVKPYMPHTPQDARLQQATHAHVKFICDLMPQALHCFDALQPPQQQCDPCLTAAAFCMLTASSYFLMHVLLEPQST